DKCSCARSCRPCSLIPLIRWCVRRLLVLVLARRKHAADRDPYADADGDTDADVVHRRTDADANGNTDRNPDAHVHVDHPGTASRALNIQAGSRRGRLVAVPSGAQYSPTGITGGVHMTGRMFAIGLAAGVFTSGPCLAQVTAEQLTAAEIRTEKVGDNLYVLFGLGGNIAVSVGTDGVLAVDTEFPELVPRYLAAIREVGGGEIDIAVNTHWHYDHADGNLVLGPTGTWIIAHASSRAMLTKDNVINTV